MDKSLSGKSLCDGPSMTFEEYAARYTGPISSVGPEIGRVEGFSLVRTIRRGFGHYRRPALRYSGTWAPRSRTTPGALRTTMRRTLNPAGREAWPMWLR